MGTCAFFVMGVGNYRGVYGVRVILDNIKYIEVCNCVVSTVLGSSVIFLLGSVLEEGQDGKR